MIFSLILALIPVEGPVYQDVVQEFSSYEACIEVHDRIVEELMDIDDHDLWVTKRLGDTQVLNLDTLDEYRIMCLDSDLVVTTE